MTTFNDLKWNKPAHTDQRIWDDLMKREIPDRRNEAWKYAPLKSRLPSSIVKAGENSEPTPSAFFGIGKEVLLVDGHSQLNAVEGGFNDDHLISILAKSFAEKTFLLNLGKNEKHEIELRTVMSKASEGASVGIDLEIKIESGAEVLIIDDLSFSGEPCHLYRRIHFDVNKNAKVKVLTTSRGEKGAHFFNRITANVDRDGSFKHFLGQFNGQFSRHDLHVNLQAENAHTNLDGLYELDGDSFCDYTSKIEHLKPHTYSYQLVKGVLEDEARAAFTGHVRVHRDAQQIDSSQLNKNLLLSKKAKVDTRPQLEVDADDVKCGHGATVGQLSEDEKFYLESRGIKGDRAAEILCHAFVAEVIDRMEEETFSKKLYTWMKH